MEPTKIFEVYGGVQQLYQFLNGYGASVVKHPYSYGGPEGFWELAVVKWDGADCKLCYTTEITDDVIGWLTAEEVMEYLVKISNLPAKA